MQSHVFVSLAVLVAPCLLAAQERGPITAEDLYRLHVASAIDVSPDGQWVAYIVSRADSSGNTYRADVWLSATDGSDTRQLTWTEDATESQPTFAPDGRHLAFVSRRQDDEHTQIYVLPLRGGGEARPVTKMETGAFNPSWSPDGRRITFLSSIDPHASDAQDTVKDAPDRPMTLREKLNRNAAEGDPMVITRLDFLGSSTVRRERWDQIFVIDAFEAGAEPVQITSGPFPHTGLDWSPDSRMILYSATPAKGDYHPDYELDSDVWAIPAEPHSMHTELTTTAPADSGILAPEVAGRASIPRPGQWSDFGGSYSPDGRRIAYLRRSLDGFLTAQHTELVLMEVDGSHPECISCGLDRSVRGYDWDQEGRLYFTVNDRGAVPLYRTRPDGTQPKRILDGPRGVRSFAVGAGTIAWAETNPSEPSEVYVSTLSGADVHRITHLNDSLLASVDVRPYEELWFDAPDGKRIQGWVVRPPDDGAAAAPMAVEIHGGPHVMWGPGESTMWHEYQVLANAGYLVFLSNPRGSDGYGFEWKRAIHRNWGALPMGDIMAGADAVIARGWADAAQQVITGGSYGGYLTAWIVGHTDRFKAGVAQRGVYDMLTWYGGSFTWRLFESEFGTVPWEEPMVAWDASPIASVQNINTPLLLIHGERDHTATIAGAELLFRALKVLGKEVEFIRYPRANHELSRSGEPRQRVDRLLRIQEFFDRYVRGHTSEAGR